MTNVWLGLDIGTSRCKALVLDEHGTVLEVTAHPTPFVEGPHGSDMAVDAFRQTLRRLVAGLAVDPAHIAGVGIASMGESGTLIDPHGAPVLPIAAWFDDRGTATAQRITTGLGADVVRVTGRPARAATTVAKLGWWVERGHDVRGTWLGVAGLAAWWLTGERAQEPSLAATSGALDLETLRYDTHILELAGLDHLAWAELVPAGQPVGHVTTQGGAEFGLPASIPVTIAGHDHLVGALGVGARHGDVVDSMGSGEALLGVGVNADQVHHARIEVVNQDRWDLTATPLPGSPDLAVILEGLLPGPALHQLASRLDVDRVTLDRRALGAEPVSPLGWGALARLQAGEDIGLDDDPVLVWARCLEGYAAAAAEGEATLRAGFDLTGDTLLMGGGLRSKAWLAAKRRRAAWPVRVADEPEAVAHGAAMFAARAAGAAVPATQAPTPAQSGA